ncbi:glycosyltransferase [Vibrio chagasii]|uniref:glycosyltransferase n=1 Tax=Vibrio chagasii TaxID=170679 RepID=UPI003DA94322
MKKDKHLENKNMNDSRKEFSVLLSLYDGEAPNYLDLCLRSIFDQTLAPKEVVLVIDGPIRQELKSILSYWSDFIPILEVAIDNNVGLAKALNLGLLKCNYDLVIRMDTDDICKKDRFEKQVDFLQKNTNIDICGSDCDVISQEGNVYDELIVPKEHSSIKRLIWCCPIVHPTVIFRKSSILRIGGYSETTPRRQDDYELWIRAASRGLIFSNLPEKLIYYRLAKNLKTKNTFSVAWNRAKIGFVAVKQNDPRLFSYLALCFPMLRAIIPNSLFSALLPWIHKIDPRRRP